MKRLITAILLALCTSHSFAYAPYGYATAEKRHIDVTAFGQCLASTTLSSFPQFYISKKEMNHPYSYMPFLKYLGANPQRVNYATGKESELRTWILSQPNNTIAPIDLYESALHINQGNIWNALLSIYELLRNEARFQDTRYYHYYSTEELQRTFFDKFVDIRGDLAERGGKFKGDHAGTWYRIWGIMLYRLQFASESKRNHWMSRVSTNALSYITGEAAEIWKEVHFIANRIGGSDEQNDPDKKRKAEYNRRAALTMGKMLKALAHPTSIEVSESDCERMSYMR